MKYGFSRENYIVEISRTTCLSCKLLFVGSYAQCLLISLTLYYQIHRVHIKTHTLHTKKKTAWDMHFCKRPTPFPRGCRCLPQFPPTITSVRTVFIIQYYSLFAKTITNGRQHQQNQGRFVDWITELGFMQQILFIRLLSRNYVFNFHMHKLLGVENQLTSLSYQQVFV